MDPAPTHPPNTDTPPAVVVPDWLRFEPYFFAICGAVVLLFLFAWPGDWPPGFFIDEVSVGYNARWVGKTLHDQYGTFLPLYFRALEDFKSPLYVYGAVLPEALFGPSKLAERLTSTLYMLGMSGLLFLVVRELTGRVRLARWLALLALLVPSLFFYAHGGFSEASCLPFWLLLALYALLRFEREPNLRSAIACGGSMGLLTYAYTTSRLMAPLLLLATLVVFFRAGGAHRRYLPAMGITGAVLGLPTAIFILVHPHELDRRYRTMVSVFRDDPTPLVAGQRIVGTYFQHLFSLDFLFRSGQHHVWHNVGEGLLPLWLYAPMLLGAYALWTRRRTPFAQVFFVLWAISAIPVALTWENLPHTNRFLHFDAIALVLGALGLDDYLKKARPPPGLVALLLVAALCEGGLMLRTSFIDYWESFGSGGGYDGGVADALQTVFRLRPAGAAVYLPDDFFDFDGLRVAYFGDVAPGDFREHRFDELGIHRLKLASSATSGALIVERKSAVPPQPASLVGAVRPPGANEALWSVYRVQ
jgi:Dolichyl-phosphate-mannose-protein mannosyltransferase